MIAILDLGAGNLLSVFNSLNSMGINSKIIPHSELNEKFTHLIIPGVGSFGHAMKKVNIKIVKKKILEFYKSERPILGICLGMQLMADYGEEGDGAEGFGLISGKAIKIPRKNNLILPHVGWNTVKFVRKHPIFENIKSEIDCYFVHTYYFQAEERNNIFGETQYGINFTSVIGQKNLIGFQFHPEKSHKNGLKLLENFYTWNGKFEK